MKGSTKKSLNCDLCSFESTSARVLKSHFQAKHTKTEYECENCNFQTENSFKLKEHQKQNHSRKRKFCNAMLEPCYKNHDICELVSEYSIKEGIGDSNFDTYQQPQITIKGITVYYTIQVLKND